MRVLLTNDDGINAPASRRSSASPTSSPTKSGWWRPRPTSPANPIRDAERSAAAALARRPPLRRPRHTDRLRHHGIRHLMPGAAGPRPLRRQPRAERRRRHRLFGHGRRRDGGDAARHPLVRAVAIVLGRDASRSEVRDGGGPCAGPADAAARSVAAAGHRAQHQFPRSPARERRGESRSPLRASATRPSSTSTSAATARLALLLDRDAAGNASRRRAARSARDGEGRISVTPLRLDMTARDLADRLAGHLDLA